MIDRRVVRHVPLICMEVLCKFLSLSGHKIRCQLTGREVNRGDELCLEVQGQYIFLGNVKSVRCLSRKIEKMKKELDNHVKNVWNRERSFYIFIHLCRFFIIECVEGAGWSLW